MKITSLLTFLVIHQCGAFSVTRSTASRATASYRTFHLHRAVSVAATTDEPASDFGTAMPERNVYEALGIEEGKLALGVKPEEVLQYLGTREDLIEKALQDIPTFDRATAEAEIDKFLLDAEMLDLYIRFQKAVEEDPEFSVPEERKPGPFEQILSFQNIVLLYAGYFFFVAARDKFRRYVAEQESLGEWKGTNIQFIDDWIDKTRDAANAALEATSEAATSSTDAATNVGEALQSVSDTISDAASSGMAAFFHF